VSLNQTDLFEILEAFAVELRRIAKHDDTEEARRLITIAVACETIAPRLAPRCRLGFNGVALAELAKTWEISQAWPEAPSAVPAAWSKPPTNYLAFVAYQVASLTRSRSATPAQLVESFRLIGAEIVHIRRHATPSLRQRLQVIETLCRAIAPTRPRRRPTAFKFIQRALTRQAESSARLATIAEVRRTTAALLGYRRSRGTA
jgi:hypothetical protein